MNCLRSHLTTQVIEKQISHRIDLAYQFKKMVLQRFLAANLLVFLIQYVGLKMSTLNSLFFPLWIASGTAAALLFLRGPRILWGLWLGSAVAYYFANAGLLLAITSATLLILQPYILLRLCYRFGSPTLIFYQLKFFLVFLLFTAVITAMSSLALTMLFYSHIPSQVSLMGVWLSWWLGDLLGLIIFACGIVTWDAYFPQTYQLKNYLFSFSMFFGIWIVLCFINLFMLPSFSIMCTSFLFLFTLYIGLRFTWCGIIAALFIQGMILDIIFFCFPSFSFDVSSIICLQLFILLEIISGFFVAIFAKNWNNKPRDCNTSLSRKQTIR